MTFADDIRTQAIALVRTCVPDGWDPAIASHLVDLFHVTEDAEYQALLKQFANCMDLSHGCFRIAQFVGQSSLLIAVVLTSQSATTEEAAVLVDHIGVISGKLSRDTLQAYADRVGCRYECS